MIFLLEHDGGVERERRVMGEQRGQVVVQDEYALVVDGTGHLHLALDVDQTMLAGIGACRDAHREAETVIAQVHLGEAVDLAGLLAMYRDQQLAFGEGFLQALFGVVVALDARRQCRFDVGRFDQMAGTCAA